MELGTRLQGVMPVIPRSVQSIPSSRHEEAKESRGRREPSWHPLVVDHWEHAPWKNRSECFNSEAKTVLSLCLCLLTTPPQEERNNKNREEKLLFGSESAEDI